MYYSNVMSISSKKTFVIWMAASLLFSLSYPIIASDNYKERFSPTYKIKLALVNLPHFNISEPEKIDKTRSSYIDLNKKQASIKVPNNTLLVSYFMPHTEFQLNLQKNQTFNPKDILNQSKDQSIAYFVPEATNPALDKEKWEKSIKYVYKNSTILTVASGIKHIIINKHTKAGSVKINVIEINPSLNPNISIEPALARKTSCK